ncbi:MAG: hypothetical protein AAF913_18520 [Pseudomonadota bacterium]
MLRRTLTILPALGLIAACTAYDDPAATAADPPAQAQAGADIPEPPGLTSDERLIWRTLTPDAKAAASEFIANGGTLTQFVSI